MKVKVDVNSVWESLANEGYINEDDSKWAVGNAVMNFVRDMESLSDEQRGAVMRRIITLFGDGTAVVHVNTDNWTEITDGLWQYKLDPTLFSVDGGKTYYSCNDPEHKIFTSLDPVA